MPELLRTAEFWVGTILVILFALIVVEKKGYLKKFLRKYRQKEKGDQDDTDYHED